MKAQEGLEKAGKALETLERKKDHAKLIKRCHNQASKGLFRPSPTGASLALSEATYWLVSNRITNNLNCLSPN
jgi:hypothetical protein